MSVNYFGATHASSITNAQLSEVVEQYLTFYASGSGHTARAKKIDIYHFLQFLSREKGVSKIEKLTVKDWDHSSVQRFIEDCLQIGEAPATVSRRLATIKHMGRTLAEKVAGFINPAREIKPPKAQVTKPKGLTPNEIKAIKQTAITRLKVKDSFTRKRNTVIFNLLLDTGLRADEIRSLKMSQLDDKLEWIKNVRTKGKRYRNVYITSAVRADLTRYIKERDGSLKKHYPTLTKSQNQHLPLFISFYNAVPGKPETYFMGAKSIWRSIRELSSGTKLHPHLLRHSYALDLLDSTNDIRLVAQALGHSDVRVTMRYTERRDEEVAESLEKARSKKS